MKIAIIAPSPIPFGMGGAEKLYLGLQEQINRHTSHQCELIKVPIKENSFWELIDAYKTFYELDLSHFDMVISGKYPAWMLRHHNHRIYMLHCLRGLYDTYHLLALPKRFLSAHEGVVRVLELLRDEHAGIDALFAALYALKADTTVPPETFAFPAPFIREIIHALDAKAMARVKGFAAISQTVIEREEYFPLHVSVEKIYPPSNLPRFETKEGQYFFTASRLDSAKRIELIVDAYMKSRTDIPFKIAGGGPLFETLKARTANDRRIELLGFVSDEELIGLYASAYGIIFTPFDEDYGLITVEAMMSHKPVITCNDSGGVLEFAEHGKTGLIAEPNAASLSKQIERLADDGEAAWRMGAAGYEKVKSMTWEACVDSLLSLSQRALERKITVVSTYGVYPPRGGGQNRIFYLYKELAKTMRVEIVALVHESERYQKCEIAPNLFEIRVPKSPEHAAKEYEMSQKAGIPITDIAMLYLPDATPALIEAFRESAADALAVVASQPYTFAFAQRHTRLPIIQDSQNVEYTLKKQMLDDNPYNAQLLQTLFEAEKKATQEAVFTAFCSAQDVETMRERYAIDPKALIVPNGVDLHSVPYVSPQERLERQKELGFGDEKLALFIGSYHQPNIEAVEAIFDMAKKHSDFRFVIMGSVGKYFEGKSCPHNVGFAGIVTDEEKSLYLSVANVALNPMLSGSGTNLKMLDYMAAGVRVVTTAVGARGLDIPPGLVALSDVADFADAMVHVADRSDVAAARAYVESTFSWEVIAATYLRALQEVARR